MRRLRPVDPLARLIARVRPARTVSTDGLDHPVKVNLASAVTVAPGWINLDVNMTALLARAPTFVLRLLHPASSLRNTLTDDEYATLVQTHRFVHHDLRRRLPFEDGAVDFVYSSGVLDLLFAAEAQRLVAEAFRILRPGGVIRLVVPDSLGPAMRLYAEGRKREAIEVFFGADSSDWRSGQHFLYDHDLLRERLEAGGFTAVVPLARRAGRTPDLEILEARDIGTLAVEAEKPRAPSGA